VHQEWEEHLEGMKNKYYYTLEVPAVKPETGEPPQYYFSNTLWGLVWSIISHRFKHFRNGEGWRD